LKLDAWKVEGLLGADPPGCCPKELLAGSALKLKPDVVGEDVPSTPPKPPKEPGVDGRELSALCDV